MILKRSTLIGNKVSGHEYKKCIKYANSGAFPLFGRGIEALINGIISYNYAMILEIR